MTKEPGVHGWSLESSDSVRGHFTLEFSMVLNRKNLVVIICVVFVAGASTAAVPSRMRRIRSGLWGGPHIRMEVAARSASIDFDCANGAIRGPLTVDSSGNFKLHGTYTREHGGPIRSDAKPDSHPVLYAGSIKGDTMTLSVKLSHPHEDMGRFTLKRGDVGRVFKCM